jgi:hypothetical protein
MVAELLCSTLTRTSILLLVISLEFNANLFSDVIVMRSALRMKHVTSEEALHTFALSFKVFRRAIE